MVDIRMIVACSENRVIGRDGRLPWRLPEDLRYFFTQTEGGALIVGRKVFQELDGFGKVDSARHFVVVSRDDALAQDGVEVVRSLPEAITAAEATGRPVWICGGQRIYEEGLAWTDRLFLTLVHAHVEGDTFFPPWKDAFPEVVSARRSEDKGFRYTFMELARPAGAQPPARAQ